MDNAVAAVKREVELSHASGRLLTPVYGTFDQMVLELRFQTLAEYEKFWADWWSLPTTQQFVELWPSLFMSGGNSELWQIDEPLAAPGTGKIVNRRTFQIKPAKYDEVVDLLKPDPGETNPFEIQKPIFGPNDTIALDFNFESVSAHDEAWANWWEKEESKQFMEQWVQLMEPGGTNEIYEVR